MNKSSMMVCSLALVAAPFALAHCSGGSAGAIHMNNDAGGKDDIPSSSGSQGGPGDGAAGEGDGGAGSGGDDGSSPPRGDAASPSGDGAAPGTDAGTTPPSVPVPDGGAPSDPGNVQCGGSPCSTSASYCCESFADGGTSSCVAPNTGCATGSYSERCNEASDCNGGVCCQTINGVGVPGDTSCSAAGATCPAVTTFQICRTDSECASDAGALQRCVPQVCTNPTTHQSFEIEACAVGPTYDNLGPALYGCVAK